MELAINIVFGLNCCFNARFIRKQLFFKVILKADLQQTEPSGSIHVNPKKAAMAFTITAFDNS